MFHLFVVRTPVRHALRDHLKKPGSPTQSTTRGRSTSSPPTRTSAFVAGSLPVAESLAGESCSLPIFPTISEQEIERIATVVAEFDADGD